MLIEQKSFSKRESDTLERPEFHPISDLAHESSVRFEIAATNLINWTLETRTYIQGDFHFRQCLLHLQPSKLGTLQATRVPHEHSEI